MRLAKLVGALSLLFLLAGSSPVFAESSHHSLSLTLTGGILDSGTQDYSHQGGRVVLAFVGGVPMDPSSADLRYSLHAIVSGFNVQGQASFELGYSSSDGTNVKIDGSAPINGMVPAEFFPFTCPNPDGSPTKDCTSAIPGAFTGSATVTTETCQGDNQGEGGGDQSQSGGDGTGDHGGDNSNKCQTTSSTLRMQFESAFLNPFGGPIVMASDDKSLVIVATYDEAKVKWAGIQMGGSVGGSATGLFGMVVSATEDLKKGQESDRGMITFTGMSVPSLNAAGEFSGESTIPKGGVDCSSLTGFPNTCHVTGFHSDGHFSMKNGLGGKIKGEYSTEWTVPAVAFTSTVTAAFK